MKKCPYCAEEIQDEAIKCKHCGSDLKQPTAGATPDFRFMSLFDTPASEVLKQNVQPAYRRRIAIGFFGLVIAGVLVLVPQKIAEEVPFLGYLVLAAVIIWLIAAVLGRVKAIQRIFPILRVAADRDKLRGVVMPFLVLLGASAGISSAAENIRMEQESKKQHNAKVAANRETQVRLEAEKAARLAKQKQEVEKAIASFNKNRTDILDRMRTLESLIEERKTEESAKLLPDLRSQIDSVLDPLSPIATSPDVVNLNVRLQKAATQLDNLDNFEREVAGVADKILYDPKNANANETKLFAQAARQFKISWQQVRDIWWHRKDLAKDRLARSEAEQVRLEKIRGPEPLRSSWDGSVTAVDLYLKEILKDPDSYKHDRCGPIRPIGELWVVECTYRAKNSFGGMIREGGRFYIQRGGYAGEGKVVRHEQL